MRSLIGKLAATLIASFISFPLFAEWTIINAFETGQIEWYQSKMAEKYEQEGDMLQKTIALQTTINANQFHIKEWERKYANYLKNVNGYASALKASCTIVEDAAKTFLSIQGVTSAIHDHGAEGIVSTAYMDDVFLDCIADLMSCCKIVKNVIAANPEGGVEGKDNMLTGRERTEILWMVEEKLASFNTHLHRLEFCIRYYRLIDIWNEYTAGMYRNKAEIVNNSQERWARTMQAISEMSH